MPVTNPLLRLAQPPSAPVLQVTVYYAVLGGLLAAILWLFPGLADYIPINAQEFMGWGTDANVFEAVGPDADTGTDGLDTALSLVVSMAGALILMVPVAWVYMGTRQQDGYDPSIVHTTLILPIAVAGIVIIVQNSLALAFSLAGIVAGVRFRNTLRDTSDALYIFAAIGVGLAAGIGALAIAVAISFFFNYSNLIVWKLDFGSEGARKKRKRGKKGGKKERDAAEAAEIEST